MADPRIITFSVPVKTAPVTTKFGIQFSNSQVAWTDLKVAAATDLDVSLVAARQYVLDGVNAVDDANNNKQAASTPPLWYRVRLKSAGGYEQWGAPFVVPSEADFLLGIKRSLKDEQLNGGPSLLTDADYRRALANAVQAYEKTDPYHAAQVFDLTALVQDYALPDAWAPNFSRVSAIEYRVGKIPRQFLPRDFAVVDEDVDQWRFLRVFPAAQEQARIYFTTRHARDGSTVPAEMFESVLMWATGDAAEQIRAEKNQFGDLMAGTLYVSIDPRIREWAKIASTWKTSAEKVWGSPDTGARGHIDLYDWHGEILPRIVAGW